MDQGFTESVVHRGGGIERGAHARSDRAVPALGRRDVDPGAAPERQLFAVGAAIVAAADEGRLRGSDP